MDKKFNRYAEIPGLKSGDECESITPREPRVIFLSEGYRKLPWYPASRGYSEKPRALARGGSFSF